MISGNHDGTNPGSNTLRHSCLGFFPGRIHHGDQSQERQAGFVFQTNRCTFHGPAAKRQYPQALVGKLFVGPLHIRPFLRRDDAPVQHHIHGALGDHHQPAGELMNCGHQLAVRIKGDFRQPGPALTGIAFIKAIRLTQTDQSGLRGIPHFALFTDNRITAQQCRTQQRLLHRVMKVSLFSGNDLPAGIELLHRHLVLRQCAGLIGTNHRYAAQAFHCLELADDGVFPGHLLCAEGKHNGHNGGKCLRNGRYRQRHGKEERIHHVFMAQKYADGKQHCTDDQNTNGQLPAELIQAHLQRGFLLLGALEQSGNLAHLRIHPGTSNQELCTAIGDKAAGKHHVLPVAQRSVTRDLSQFLFHRQALACQGAFRTLKAGTPQQAPVGAYGISRLQHHHITRHHIPARYLKHTAIPNYLGSGGGHLLETVQRSGGLHRLHGSQNRVHGNDRQNDNRALHISQHRRHRRRQNQNDYQKIRKLFQKNPENTFLFPRLQFIGAILTQALRRLFRSQSAITTGKILQ